MANASTLDMPRMDPPTTMTFTLRGYQKQVGMQPVFADLAELACHSNTHVPHTLLLHAPLLAGALLDGASGAYERRLCGTAGPVSDVGRVPLPAPIQQFLYATSAGRTWRLSLYLRSLSSSL